MPKIGPEKRGVFSLHEIAEPRFSEQQITISISTHKAGYAPSKVCKKITVGKGGKIGYSK